MKIIPVAIALALATALAFIGTLARSQPVTNIYAILMCPTGSQDAQGNPIVTPCGGGTNPPVQTQIIGSVPGHQTFSCKPNPLTGKSPPLC